MGSGGISIQWNILVFWLEPEGGIIKLERDNRLSGARGGAYHTSVKPLSHICTCCEDGSGSGLTGMNPVWQHV